MSNYQNAIIAKDTLRNMLGPRDWITGIGVTNLELANNRYIVKLNVREVSLEYIKSIVPNEICGVQIAIQYVDNIETHYPFTTEPKQ